MAKGKTVKGVPIEIQAISRASVKIHDNFYTVEYLEKRVVPDDANMEVERAALWETVNGEVDRQIEEIVTTFKSVRKKNR